MKKIDLHLNFDEIKKRIEIDKNQYKVKEWSKLIGVEINSISNIHGKKAKAKPSLEYVVAVSNITNKPIRWYLYGETGKPSTDKSFMESWPEDIIEACKTVKIIMESDDKATAVALHSNILAFKKSIDRLDDNLEMRKDVDNLKKEIKHLKKLNNPGTLTGTD